MDTALVSFSAQTCAILPCMKECVYRIFILSSSNMSSCIVTVIWMDWMNYLVLSLFPLKLSSLATLALLNKWFPIVAGILVRIA